MRTARSASAESTSSVASVPLGNDSKNDSFVPSTVQGAELLLSQQEYNDYISWLNAKILQPMRTEIARHGGKAFNKLSDGDLYCDPSLQLKAAGDSKLVETDGYSQLSPVAKAKIDILENLVTEVRTAVITQRDKLTSPGQSPQFSVDTLHSEVHALIKGVINNRNTHASNLSIKTSKNALADVFRFLAGLLLSVPTCGLVWLSSGYKNLFWKTTSQVKVDEIYHSSMARELSTKKL